MKASRIAEEFNVSLFDANLALLIIRGRVKPEDHPRRFPATNYWLNSCYNLPRRKEIKMEALNELLQCCGVEAISVEGEFIDSYNRDIVATYLNTGDTYSPTILYDNRNSVFKLTSWGDFYESLQAQENYDD